MHISSQYDFWRSMCQSIRHMVSNQKDIFVSVEEMSNRDITPIHIAMDDETIDRVAHTYADVYTEGDEANAVFPIIFSSYGFDDLEIYKLRKKYNDEPEDKDVANHIVYQMVKLVLISYYKRERRVNNVNSIPET
jgi:hypothetical protein